MPLQCAYLQDVPNVLQWPGRLIAGKAYSVIMQLKTA